MALSLLPVLESSSFSYLSVDHILFGSWTLLFKDVWKPVQGIDLKFYSRNKTCLTYSPFNLFLSFVHWACISENTFFALANERACKSEIFNTSKLHSPYFSFQNIWSTFRVPANWWTLLLSGNFLWNFSAE